MQTAAIKVRVEFRIGADVEINHVIQESEAWNIYIMPLLSFPLSQQRLEVNTQPNHFYGDVRMESSVVRFRLLRDVCFLPRIDIAADRQGSTHQYHLTRFGQRFQVCA